MAKGQLFTHIIHVGLAKEIRNGSKEWRWLLRDKVREKEGERERREGKERGERGRKEGERRKERGERGEILRGKRRGREEEREGREREGRERGRGEREREGERESKYLKLYSSLFPMMINTNTNAAKLAVRYLKCDHTQYLHIL